MHNLTAEKIARALLGRKAGAGWMARCPAHNDRTPSLSLRDTSDGKVLVKCHAGCSQDDVISALRNKGLWPDRTGVRPIMPPRQRAHRAPVASDGDYERSKYPLRSWHEAQPASGTLVETYLRSRGITLPVPTALRFHPSLKHGPSGYRYPAMVGLVTCEGEPVAIHRTFLAPDGGRATVDGSKMALGPCAGGGGELAPATERVLVGEGIETCLSAMQSMGIPAWSGLNTSGMTGLILPPETREVIILADGDDAGERAARSAAHRWGAEGRIVRIARPPWGFDFNDVLLGKHIVKEAS